MLRESDGKATQTGVWDFQAWLLGEDARSDQFQFVSFYGDGHRALNGFNGDHKILIPALRQNSFKAVQATASNSHRLSDFEESVQGARDFLSQKFLQILNLLRRNRNWESSEADDPDDTFGVKNVDS